MIVSLSGTVLRAQGSAAVIEVAGVGYLVNVTPAHALSLRVGEQARLSTVQVFREDAVSLFGFATEDEREVFEVLLGVSGVGPKSALGVLSALAPADIAAAVAAEDDGVFRKVSGIGPKTAKLIVVSLAGKVQVVAGSSRSAGQSSSEAVVAALVGLGWQQKLAEQAVAEVWDAADETTRASVPELLRRSLAQLSGGRP